MPKRKSKKIFQYLFLFLIIGTLNNKNLSTFELPKIDEIIVSGLSKKENLEVLKSLEKFKENNLFFLSKFELVKIIEKNDYIEKFFVSKKYPSSLNIHLQKTKLMAIVNKDAKFFILDQIKNLLKHLNKQKIYLLSMVNLILKNFLKLKRILINQILN